MPEYKTCHTSSGDEFILSGAYTDSGAMVPESGWPVVLVYHGGGETAQQILAYSNLGYLLSVVISIQGQKSYNTSSWMNAFPWLKLSTSEGLPRNDVQVTVEALTQVAGMVSLDMSRIYATGKSDGGGMAVFLAAHPELRNFDIRAIAPISGAYFGVHQTYGYQPYTFPGTAAGYHNIVLPPSPIPVLEMHGTADRRMSYSGQEESNQPQDSQKPGCYYGRPGSFWASPRFPKYSAWTANIPVYWQQWAVVNGNVGDPVVNNDFSLTPGQQSILYSYSNPGAAPVQFVEVIGGNHDWFGHTKSGPDIDATMLISDFFGIPLWRQA
jgi:poly(3-hydroxybutyrate) depolymerase